MVYGSCPLPRSIGRKGVDQVKQGIERLGRNFTPETAHRMCMDKRAWPSRNEARDFAIRGKKNGNSSTTPYRCQLCSKWHLTSLSKQDSAAVRKRNWRTE